jgi:hypothetical protein
MISNICPTCKKQQTPFLDPETNKVYCGDCEVEIQANHFLKVQLKALRQFKEKKIISFASKCPHCATVDRPKLLKGQALCKACNGIIPITRIHYNMLTEIYENDKKPL